MLVDLETALAPEERLGFVLPAENFWKKWGIFRLGKECVAAPECME